VSEDETHWKSCGNLWGQSTTLETFPVTIRDPGRGLGIIDGTKAGLRPWAAADDEKLSSHLAGQIYWVGPLVTRLHKSVC